MNFRNQKIISFAVLVSFLASVLFWFFSLHSNIANNLSSISEKYEQEKRVDKELERIENKLGIVTNNFLASNDKFNNLLRKIPSINDRDNALALFKDIIQAHSLKINKFEPTQCAIEEKIMSIAETGKK